MGNRNRFPSSAAAVFLSYLSILGPFRYRRTAGRILYGDTSSQARAWRGMLDLGLTTVAETPEPTRSDSHAWSAHPNYGLLATVLGVRPAKPGFKRVRIAPV
jgi:hypothetical protein